MNRIIVLTMEELAKGKPVQGEVDRALAAITSVLGNLNAADADAQLLRQQKDDIERDPSGYLTGRYSLPMWLEKHEERTEDIMNQVAKAKKTAFEVSRLLSAILGALRGEG